MTSGLHHLTLITRKVQANVDFYVGFLGLRLIKRTAGFEDAEQLHLFYGDAVGSPGSLVTFLVWEDGSPGRVGHGQVGEIAFAIAPSSIGFWLSRCLERGIAAEGPRQEFGEPVLRLRDPDGFVVKLVGVDLPTGSPWAAQGIPESDAIRRLRGATILSERQDETAAFLARFGWRERAVAGSLRRLVSASRDVIDLRDAAGFWPGAQGTGIADHVALRVGDGGDIAAVDGELRRGGDGATNLHDRLYFTSLYVREPGGTLVEFATEGPGFTLDESPEALGTTLMVPPLDRERADAIRLKLPQFSLPGQARMARRDLAFVHRLHVPPDPDGSTLVLLHGTGGNETDLFPFGHAVAPRATLLGVRGRSTEEGIARWFRRLTPMTFDQADVRAEAEAFVVFMHEAAPAYGMEPGNTAYLGYSNGANLLGAIMLLHPGAVRRAALLRPVNVLEAPPGPDLSGTDVLMLVGAADPYGPHAPELQGLLGSAGANVLFERIEAGHDLGKADIDAVGAWLGRSGTSSPIE